MTHALDAVVRGQAEGQAVGITSVCSAHPLVLEATVRQAVADGTSALIEATSNQVDQFGGYTGMRPADFAELVHGLAARSGLGADRVVLGGDHLGPNRWRHLTPEEAMGHADDLVAAYVRAGFTKIHLDCSYPCVGDPDVLTDDIVATRSARLLAVAEAAAVDAGAVGGLRYVIGTEVPVPGGAHETIDELVPTTAEAARATVAAHREAFAALDQAHAWPQVRALVVQPGVEFDHLRVIDYDRSRTRALSAALDNEPTMAFEAHSTDYQTGDNLAALVADHWAVLKVGPGLTFALREALFALAAIEDELYPTGERSDLLAILERRMLAEPGYWRSYYAGPPDEQRLARRYSYSDRLRYYWPDPDVHAAQERLLDNLTARAVPLPLLSQHLPSQYARVRAGGIESDPRALVVDHIRDVLRAYALATSDGINGDTLSAWQ